MRNLEIRTIEHKGVKVTIRIDYDKGTASLMERSLRGDWVAKNWLFQDRVWFLMSLVDGVIVRDSKANRIAFVLQ